MPELPDVEVFRRRVASAALQQRIDHVTVRNRRVLGNVSPQAVDARLAGHAFTDTRRHGKHLFLHLDSGDWLDVHFGMTGSFRYFDDRDPEPASDRVTIDFKGGGHLGYYDRRMLGEINLVNDPRHLVESKHLGPDALDARFDLEAFKQAAAGSRAAVKAMLMDQSAIAGIGNVYSDEILFQARVHPQTKVNALDEAALERLYRATKTVLKTAIAHEANPDKMPEGYLLPHRRAGHRCPVCGGTIAQLKIGGRSSYFCPRCQHGP